MADEVEEGYERADSVSSQGKNGVGVPELTLAEEVDLTDEVDTGFVVVLAALVVLVLVGLVVEEVLVVVVVGPLPPPQVKTAGPGMV